MPLTSTVWLTPRGFPFRVEEGRQGDVPEFLERASTKLHELMKDCQDPVVNLDSWEWTSDALLTVVGILTFAPTILTEGLNPAVHGSVGVGERVPDFLLDTWKFIRTGKQIMHPRNWRDLMTYEQPSHRHGVSQKDIEAGKVLILPGYDRADTIHRLVSLWINKPEYAGQHCALDHVIQTLFGIFAKNPIQG